MFKRLVAVATATMLTIAMSVSAFAAVTDAQKAKIEKALQDNNLSTDSDIYKQVLTVLDDSEMNLSDADVETITGQIDVVRDAIRDINAKNPGTIKDYASLKAAVANNETLNKTVTGAIETAGKAAGITDIKVDLTGSAPAITYKTPSGKEMSIDLKSDTAPAPSAEIGKTGVDFSTTTAVVAGLGLSVVGIAVIAKKKDLVNA